MAGGTGSSDVTVPVGWRRSNVTAGDGVELAVFSAGPATGPPVLLVHGYPDTHAVWDGVAAALAVDHRVTAFDGRGAGVSGAPGFRSGYRLDRLADDLDAVARWAGAAGAPAGAVHLVAHDWGSVQAWHAVTRIGAAPYASLTSISGPHLPYAAAWLRTAAATNRRALVRQLVASWYIGLFGLPWLPELLWRCGVLGRLLGRHGRTVDVGTAVRGLGLYRVNARVRIRPRPCPVPVLVLAPVRDRYITGTVARQAPAPWADRLTSVDIDGGHWGFVDDPALVIGPLTAFMTGLQPGGAAPR